MKLLKFLSRCGLDTWLEIEGHYTGPVRKLNAAKYQDATVAYWTVTGNLVYIRLGG